jgi:ribosome-associated protein
MILQRMTTLKKPVKKASKKTVKKTAKKAVKKVAKKVAKKPAKVVAKKAGAKKPAVKSVIKKAAPKKTVKAKAKVVVKKPVKLVAEKAVAKPGLTKTAERKAKKAAKAKVAVVKKPMPAAAPQWPPMVSAVLKQLDDAKAEQIVTLDLSSKSTIADTMIVATGRSNRHVNAIADQVVDELSKHGMKNIRIEGVPQCDWVLVDAGDVIVHVFRPEVRSFYNLEKLWAANIPE